MKYRLLYIMISILMSIFIFQGCASNKPKENMVDLRLMQLIKAQNSLIKLGYLSFPAQPTVSIPKEGDGKNATPLPGSSTTNPALPYVDEVELRVAIRDFQKVQGLQPTGEVTPELFVALTDAENAEQTKGNPQQVASSVQKDAAATKAVCKTFIGKRSNGSVEQKGGCSSQATKDDVVKHYQEINQEKVTLMPGEYKIVETH